MNDKKQDILDAIDELFGDTSVPAKTTLDQLEEIRDEAQSKIDALKHDLEK